jgi:hypothetical protein
MANETTSSTYSTHSLSYILGENAVPANLPSMVVSRLANEVDIDGQPSNTFQVAVHADLGAALGGTEGTAITSNTALSYASAIQGAVVEGALVRAVVTDNAVASKFPGLAGVSDAMQTLPFEQKLAVLQPEVDRLAAMCMEKYEDDHCNLLGGFSNTAGTSGSDLSTADIFSAIYTFDTLDASNQNRALVLTPNQVDELRRDLAVTSGGLGGSLWSAQIDASIFGAGGIPENGLIGSFMGIPVYQYSHSLRTLENGDGGSPEVFADVAGALIAIGSGDPTVAGNPVGALLTVRKGGLKVRLEQSAAERGTIVVVSMEYVAVELKDAHGVSIITDAP